MNPPMSSKLKLYVERSNSNPAATPADEAAVVAVATPTLEDLRLELERTRRALSRREAELAAGVPLVPQAQPQRHLSERMEAVLKGVAEALGCKAAGVYLLDAATTELKLRSCWGLPFERYLDAPRPLHAAVADVEALAGHAVVLEDVKNYASWNLPDALCRAAVCVPVSSPTVPLGTLWLFADAPRDFTDAEVNIIEIGAGRIASDLEREMLMTEMHDTARLRRAWDDVGYRREARTPRVAPLCDSWEVAGRTLSADGGFAEFFDWRTTDDGGLAAAVGSVEQTDFAAALDVESLRAAWRAHARHSGEVGRWLEWMNADLWSGSAETSPVDLVALRTLGQGALSLICAGRAAAVVLGPDRVHRIETAAVALGTDPDVHYHAQGLTLNVGEVVVMSNEAKLIDRLVAAGREAFSERSANFSATRRFDRLVELLETDDSLRGTLVVVRRKS